MEAKTGLRVPCEKAQEKRLCLEKESTEEDGLEERDESEKFSFHSTGIGAPD